jgi:UDP-N-acetylglucosamine 2-epimerase (non-hydrolysing)
MKIVSIVGARPQFIKCAPVSKELRKKNHEILVHTGQHYDYELSKVFFDQLGIPAPDYNLEVGSASHGKQTGMMLVEIEKVLVDEKPDAVLVYGDTNSTLAGALASVKLHIPIGHVEAGLRSFDRTMPEEINRVLTDHASDLLFVPTQTAVNHLKNEGISQGVFLVGDVMYDVLKQSIPIARKSQILKTLSIQPKEYYLATIHRPSNTDTLENLSTIIKVLFSADKQVIFPIHPRTKHFIKEHGLERSIGQNVKMISPVSYFDFLWLEQNAEKILTDSGGIQKESYLLKVPCITLRENTEWVETIEDGWNILVGTNKEKIRDAIQNFNPTGEQRELFGTGDASTKIVKILEDYRSDSITQVS